MKENTSSRRIAALLRERIRRGELRGGDRLPSTRQIVREHGVAIATASKVLSILQRERLARAVPGVGTVVRTRDDGPDLSVERIVRVAIAIADDEGLAALSMRGVAAELGVATMSLYRYVASKEQLVLRMSDAVMDVPMDELPVGWRAKLEQLARMQWKTYSAHPWLAPAVSMTRPQVLPKAMQHTERVLEAVAELEPSPERALQTAVSFIAYVRGMAMSIEPEREAERDTGMNSDEWVRSQEEDFAPIAARYPTLSKMMAGPEVDMSLDVLFERGLTCFLEGLQAFESQSAPKMALPNRPKTR